MSNVDRLYIATNDGYLIVGSDPDGVATALGVIDGDREENTLASSDLYQELMRRRGDKNDIYAAVLLTNLADTIIQIDDSGMAMMILPMVKSFVGDVDGISQSINISASNDAVFESDYTVYMGDGRNGSVSFPTTLQRVQFLHTLLKKPSPIHNYRLIWTRLCHS